MNDRGIIGKPGPQGILPFDEEKGELTRDSPPLAGIGVNNFPPTSSGMDYISTIPGQS
jgi:hypothetical protein